MCYILYPDSKVSWRRENVTKTLKEEKIHLLYYTVFIGKNIWVGLHSLNLCCSKIKSTLKNVLTLSSRRQIRATYFMNLTIPFPRIYPREVCVDME